MEKIQIERRVFAKERGALFIRDVPLRFLSEM